MDDPNSLNIDTKWLKASAVGRFAIVVACLGCLTALALVLAAMYFGVIVG